MTYPDDFVNKIICGDCIEVMKQIPDDMVQCCVTSPPYWGLRDYGVDGQLGLEKTPEEYVARLVEVFREVRRVLKNDGTLWLNLGDSYWGGGNNRGNNSPISEKQGSNAGAVGQCAYHQKNIGKHHIIKSKDLVGIPWMVAFALRKDGWYLRSDIIWHKPSVMPESVTDRPTKSHEYIFLLAKSEKYFYDHEAIMELATGYDGRKDEMFKGYPKYKDKPGMDIQGNSHNRWKFKNLADKGQQPNSIHLKRLNGNGDEQYPVRNKRTVWTVPTKPFSAAHFATFPPKLIVDCIKAGCPEKGLVLDPFMGSGTTAMVCRKLGRYYLGIELNPDYIKIANETRLAQEELFA